MLKSARWFRRYESALNGNRGCTRKTQLRPIDGAKISFKTGWKQKRWVRKGSYHTPFLRLGIDLDEMKPEDMWKWQRPGMTEFRHRVRDSKIHRPNRIEDYYDESGENIADWFDYMYYIANHS